MTGVNNSAPIMDTHEPEEKHRSSKHHKEKKKEKHKHRPHDKDRDADSSDRKHKKRRARDDEYESKERKHKQRRKGKDSDEGRLAVVDDDINDEDMWVEKNIDMEGERVRIHTYYLCMSPFTLS
jgi:hypothetical protein